MTAQVTGFYPVRQTNLFDPPHVLAHLRATEPVARVELPVGGWAWLVTRHADVRFVLRDERFSSDVNQPGFPMLRRRPPEHDRQPPTFLRMDPPAHTWYRRMLIPQFTVRAAARMEPLIAGIVEAHLDALVAAGPPADLVAGFALPVPSMVLCTMLGVPYAEHDFFQDRAAVLLRHGTTVAELSRATRQLRTLFGEVVAAKRFATDPGDDVLGRLAAQGSDAATAADLAGVAQLLLIAGHDATAQMLALGMFALLRHPDQLAVLRADPGRAASASEELLRYLTVLHVGMPRVAVADVEVGGQLLRAGESVMAMGSSANRDGSVFDDPDRLDVCRGNAHRHLSFGFGVHQCLGQALVRAVLRLAFPALLRRLPGLRLAVPAERVPLRDGMLIHGVHRMPVAW